MLDSLISGGLGLLGKLFGASQQESYNKQQMQLAQQQMAMQYEFAKNGIQWKVADAQAAGIHPLVALGASTSSPSAVSVGGSAPDWDLSALGQDIGRAFKASQSEEVRQENDLRKASKLQLEKGSLENDILRQELASREIRNSRQMGQIGPPMPTGWASHLASSPNRSPEGVAFADDDIKQKQIDVPQQKFSRPWGYKLEHHPSFSDGQVIEDRYGDSELGSTAKFIANQLADHWYTFGPSWNPSRGRRTSSGGAMNRPRGMKGSYR